MDVYIVIEWSRGNSEIIAVFSDKLKADEYIDRRRTRLTKISENHRIFGYEVHRHRVDVRKFPSDEIDFIEEK